ncbi:MAG TPA: cysteine hydrolase family protein [Ktedonobacteraceae bacterium]|nr:cysteine hydrolase family protein [Ktedonobacteraceae bacterium]
MKRALLVIDVQNEYFSGAMPVTYPADSLEHITQAMDAASEINMPIVVIQHAQAREEGKTFCKGSQTWELHPEIAKRTYDVLIEKNLPGSFTGTHLETWLREHDIDSVVISGYMTQMCCDTTARQAAHLGFNVEFLSDATGTLAFNNSAGEVSAQDLHQHILVVQQSGFSRVMSTAEWIEKSKNS